MSGTPVPDLPGWRSLATPIGLGEFIASAEIILLRGFGKPIDSPLRLARDTPSQAIQQSQPELRRGMTVLRQCGQQHRAGCRIALRQVTQSTTILILLRIATQQA